MLLKLREIGVANFTESAGFGLPDLLDFLLLHFLLLGFLLQVVVCLRYPDPTSKFPDPLLGVAWKTERRGAGFTIKPQHWPGLQLRVDWSVQAGLLLEFDSRGHQLLLLRLGFLLAAGTFAEAVLGFVFEEPLEGLGERPDVGVADPESAGFFQHRGGGVTTGRSPRPSSDGLCSGVWPGGTLSPVCGVNSRGGGGGGGSL